MAEPEPEPEPEPAAEAEAEPEGEPEQSANEKAIAKLSEDEIEQYKDAFNLFDADGGGTIDAEELGQVMAMLGQDPKKEELEAMINEVGARPAQRARASSQGLTGRMPRPRSTPTARARSSSTSSWCSWPTTSARR
jgi:hypothetical protein